jgi:lipopolysaccharide export system protein LptA
VTRRTTFLATAIAAVALVGASAGAQQGTPNAVQGFSSNRGKPVTIRAASLEVRDKQKFATFTGDVHVVQGDTDMRCKVLVVFYEGESVATGAVASAQPGPGAATPGNGQIRRMEAKGGVVVTQKDQVATGDRADFDMKTNTVMLTGNVVVTKGQDVLRGEKLVVNLTDGVSKMDAGTGGRVEVMMNPRQDPKAGDSKSADPKSTDPKSTDPKSAQGQSPTQSQGKSARPARPN